MTPYALRAGYIPADKAALFDQMRRDVDRMPDLDPMERVSCHAVCRALAMRHRGVRCVDGFFMAVGHEHSWLDMGDGLIADMYPIAATNPFMVDAGSWMVPWNRLYIEKADLLDDHRGRRAGQDLVAGELVAALDLADHDAMDPRVAPQGEPSCSS